MTQDSAPRLQEQFGYAYDKAWNLSERTNNALIQTFKVNSLNELTNAGLSGTLTVAGATTELSGDFPYDNDPGVTSVRVKQRESPISGLFIPG